MQVTVNPEKENLPMTAEQRLATVGARIDALIAKASQTRMRVSNKLHGVKETGGEAIEELKFGLDRAWEDLNLAWSDIKEGAEKAAHKFQPCDTKK